MSVMKETGTARRSGRGWTRAAFVLGVLAVVSYAVGYLAVAHLWVGDPLVIGVATTLQYLLPLAGVLVGRQARRHVGPRWESTVGLVLSYLFLAFAVVPVVIGLAGLLLAR
ncbi:MULTISPECIES: hypothetical protein [unclassified Rathayibacter]|uniref:hypothetical protein n=1 Tax=unclassified Rathayibacter TaxID=2609250 RepID=UPI000CE7906B|nr:MULTISPECIES: hypothetical protein [unclassified Rathayibacter]PPF24924.1 hypothetical protein C5C54_15540 [Rathayibacter sp. AY1F2]